MKIGYGTYGMQTENIFAALPRLRDIGYEAVEINAGDDWPTAPHKFNRADRTRLVEQLQDLNFPSPVLMCLLSICTQGDDRSVVLQKLDDACRLANDLNFGNTPAILVSTPGGLRGDWETVQHQLCDTLTAVADQTAKHNVILAVEPHAGQPLDTPDKVAYLMQQTRHPFLKINFDHSHFHVAGIDLQHSVDLCAPYTVSTHIKDGFMAGGQVHYQLPGEGTLDLVAYFKAVDRASMMVPITVEITAQIWRQPGYDPWVAAEKSFNALDQARQQVAG